METHRDEGLVGYQKQEAARLWPILCGIVGTALSRETLIWHIELQDIILFPAPSAVLLTSIQNLDGDKSLCVVSAGDPDQLSDLLPFAEVCARRSDCSQIIVGASPDWASELHGYETLPIPARHADLINVCRRLVEA
jgi:hypothetical protein